MTYITQFIHGFGHKIHEGSARLAHIHPWLSCFILCIGGPLLILAAVFGLTAAVLLPFALLCGWI